MTDLITRILFPFSERRAGFQRAFFPTLKTFVGESPRVDLGAPDMKALRAGIRQFRNRKYLCPSCRKALKDDEWSFVREHGECWECAAKSLFDCPLD